MAMGSTSEKAGVSSVRRSSHVALSWECSYNPFRTVLNIRLGPSVKRRDVMGHEKRYIGRQSPSLDSS